METDPTPLNYRSPQRLPTRGVFNEAACYAGIIIAMVLLVDLLFVVPRFEAIFKDFGTKLPVMTEWLLIASRWTRGGLWVLFVVLPVPFGFLVALVQPVGPEPEDPGDVQTRRRRPGTRWPFRLVALAIVIIALVTVFALFLPMISLIQAVSG